MSNVIGNSKFYFLRNGNGIENANSVIQRNGIGIGNEKNKSFCNPDLNNIFKIQKVRGDIPYMIIIKFKLDQKIE